MSEGRKARHQQQHKTHFSFHLPLLFGTSPQQGWLGHSNDVPLDHGRILQENKIIKLFPNNSHEAICVTVKIQLENYR